MLGHNGCWTYRHITYEDCRHDRELMVLNMVENDDDIKARMGEYLRSLPDDKLVNFFIVESCAIGGIYKPCDNLSMIIHGFMKEIGKPKAGQDYYSARWIED